MTAREDPTLAAEAQTKALAAIEQMKQLRLAEGHTEASLALTKALAAQVCTERLTTDQVVGTTKSGRLIVEPGEQGEATAHWFAKVLKPKTEPTIEGGPHQLGAQT